MSIEFEIKDCQGRTIFLYSDAWIHIKERHFEMAAYLDNIRETLQDPDIILEQREDVYHYSRLGDIAGPYRDKYLKVLVRRKEGILRVATAWFDPLPGEGKAIWLRKRQNY